MKQLLLVIFILLNPNILNALELKGDFFQGNLKEIYGNVHGASEIQGASKGNVKEVLRIF